MGADIGKQCFRAARQERGHEGKYDQHQPIDRARNRVAVRDHVAQAGLAWDAIGPALKAEGRLYLETY